jgi:phosphatidylglycerol:prolipoprotein diacylglycerol transferase
MHPILFEIGSWPVYSYGVLLAGAYLVALQLAVARARRQGLDAGRVMDLGIWLIIAALVGAKLMLIVVDFDTFRRNPADLLSLVLAAGVFYGGLLAALGIAIWYMRKTRLPGWKKHIT